MSRIGVVTDSASDLEPAEAAEQGIVVVPLYVTFGDREFRAGVDLSNKDFWHELTAAGNAFPKTAAAPPSWCRSAVNFPYGKRSGSRRDQKKEKPWHSGAGVFLFVNRCGRD